MKPSEHREAFFVYNQKLLNYQKYKTINKNLDR